MNCFHFLLRIEGKLDSIMLISLLPLFYFHYFFIFQILHLHLPPGVPLHLVLAALLHSLLEAFLHLFLVALLHLFLGVHLDPAVLPHLVQAAPYLVQLVLHHLAWDSLLDPWELYPLIIIPSCIWGLNMILCKWIHVWPCYSHSAAHFLFNRA